MAISRETIETIKNHADIVEVVGDYVTLKKRGRSLMACCPFHNEKTPSFHVTPSLGIYKCFGCGKGGDAISFVMDIERLTYPEALRHLAKKYSIQLEDEILPAKEDSYNERESLYIVLSYARTFFQDKLFNTEEGQSVGLSYFKERGFSEKTIRDFELGYSLDEWDALLKESVKNGYNLTFLEKAGLVKARDEDKPEAGHYDRFRGRVMFPIHNVTGKVIAFGARTLKKENDIAKYLNSPESDVYHKSDILYGLFQAKNAIRSEENCYLVEGYTDVISLAQAGITNVVASSGTSLTVEQIRLVHRYTDNVTILYDGDPAGIKASLRGIDLLLEEGLNVRVVLFPDKEDPDSYVRRIGSTAFKEYIQTEKKDFITFKTHLFLQEVKDDPLKKAEVLRDIIHSIAGIPDGLKRSVFLKETAGLMKVEEQVLLDEYNKIAVKRAKSDKQANSAKSNNVLEGTGIVQDTIESETSEPATNTDTYFEKEIVRLLICYADKQLSEEYTLSAYLLQELEEIEFKNPLYQKIINETRSAPTQNHTPDFFLHHEDTAIKIAAVNLFTSTPVLSENWQKSHIFTPEKDKDLQKVAHDAILKLKWKRLREMIAENKKSLQSAEEEAQIVEFLKISVELKKLEIDLARTLGNVIAGL